MNINNQNTEIDNGVKEEISLLRGIFDALLGLTEKLTGERMIVPFHDEKLNRTVTIKA